MLTGAPLPRASSSMRDTGIQSSMPVRQTSVRPFTFPACNSDSNWFVDIIRRSSAVTWTIQS
jgi:hypothetical protein